MPAPNHQTIETQYVDWQTHTCVNIHVYEVTKLCSHFLIKRKLTKVKHAESFEDFIIHVSGVSLSVNDHFQKFCKFYLTKKNEKRWKKLFFTILWFKYVHFFGSAIYYGYICEKSNLLPFKLTSAIICLASSLLHLKPRALIARRSSAEVIYLKCPDKSW